MFFCSNKSVDSYSPTEYYHSQYLRIPPVLHMSEDIGVCSLRGIDRCCGVVTANRSHRVDVILIIYSMTASCR